MLVNKSNALAMMLVLIVGLLSTYFRWPEMLSNYSNLLGQSIYYVANVLSISACIVVSVAGLFAIYTAIIYNGVDK